MVTLGVVLLVVGLILGIPVLWWVGLLLIVAGLFVNLAPVGGSTRRVW